MHDLIQRLPMLHGRLWFCLFLPLCDSVTVLITFDFCIIFNWFCSVSVSRLYLLESTYQKKCLISSIYSVFFSCIIIMFVYSSLFLLFCRLYQYTMLTYDCLTLWYIYIFSVLSFTVYYPYLWCFYCFSPNLLFFFIWFLTFTPHFLIGLSVKH